MSEPRKHHIVPRFHLMRFADKKRRISMVPRTGGKPVVTHVRNACAETDFYSVVVDGQKSQEVEKFLSTMESGAAAAIDTVVAGKFPPDAANRAEISRFIGFQMVRGYVSREAAKDMQKTLDGVLADSDESVRSKYLTRSPNEDVEHMIAIAPTLALSFLERRWLLVDVSAELLVTSDAAVGRWYDRGDHPPGRGVGWGNAEEVRVPITPRLCLVGTLRPVAERKLDLGAIRGPEFAKATNFLVAAPASKWIFHKPDADPLVGIALPAPSPRIVVG